MKKDPERRVQVCPACDSRDVKSFDSVTHIIKGPDFGLTCKNCGYNGPMTLMLKKDAVKLKVRKRRPA